MTSEHETTKGIVGDAAVVDAGGDAFVALNHDVHVGGHLLRTRCGRDRAGKRGTDGWGR